jgi:hypothetical protein
MGHIQSVGDALLSGGSGNEAIQKFHHHHHPMIFTGTCPKNIGTASTRKSDQNFSMGQSSHNIDK